MAYQPGEMSESRQWLAAAASEYEAMAENMAKRHQCQAAAWRNVSAYLS
jgi:hypothetical protein